jgi:xanthine/CO dehydrogenase XdhC/CoxF family maturation factor
MNRPVQPDPQAIRTTIDAIAQRAKADPAFLTQLQDDPVGVLSGAGLPDQAIVQAMRELGLEPEVSGYMEQLDY